MPKGFLYNATKKKWETTEKIKADVFKEIDGLGDILDEEGNVTGKCVQAPLPTVKDKAKNILSALVDAIDEENTKRSGK